MDVWEVCTRQHYYDSSIEATNFLFVSFEVLFSKISLVEKLTSNMQICNCILASWLAQFIVLRSIVFFFWEYLA